MPENRCPEDWEQLGEDFILSPGWWSCLFSALPVKVSDDWSMILMEGNFFIFSKSETPKLLTAYVSPGLETELKYGTFHLSHSLSPGPFRGKIREILQLGSLDRVLDLPLRSQTCSLRESWILMAERLARETVMKHFCGLSIMILSVKRWSLIKSRLSCFLWAC